MQKIKLSIFLLSLTLTALGCKQESDQSSELQGVTQIGSSKVDLTTF